MFGVIDDQRIFIVEDRLCLFKWDAVFRLIDFVFAFIPLETYPFHLGTPKACLVLWVYVTDRRKGRMHSDASFYLPPRREKKGSKEKYKTDWGAARFLPFLATASAVQKNCTAAANKFVAVLFIVPSTKFVPAA